MYWVMRRVPLWRLTNRHAAEFPNHSPGHLPHQGRALVHHPRDGRARPEESGAAADKIRRAGRFAAAAARSRSAGAPGARHRGQRRDAGAHARRRAALCPRLGLSRHAVARGAGCRAPVGAIAQAARECARRALARSARPSPMSSTPSSAAAFATRPANGSPPGRAGRSAAARRCSARTPRRCSARRHGGPASRPSRASAAESAPLGDAQQAVPAARDQDLRLRLVSRVGRRHPVPRRDGCGKLQGRMEGQSRHAAGGDGAGRRPRRARCRDRPAAPVCATPTWAGSSTTRTPASAASR